MSWFSGWRREDPLKDIDPSLRQFLEKETPKQYRSEEEASKVKASAGWSVPTFRSLFGFGEEEATKDPSQSSRSLRDEHITHQSSQASVPQESLFQDGRYAHLWKTYRSNKEVEDAGKTDQEKLTDIVGAVKERNAELKRAALENCANEQMAIHECFSSGSWAARMTMCRAENRALEKCVGVQTKFLRALGYLSLYERSPDESEKIQMHADTLYHRLLEQEKAIDEAKEKGLPPPPLQPLMKPNKSQTAEPSRLVEKQQLDTLLDADVSFKSKRAPVKFEDLPPHLQEKYSKERFQSLEGVQLELAKRELEQDLAWKKELLTRFDERYVEERVERLERQSQGRERMSDKVKRWFDMRDWSRVDELQAQRAEEQKRHTASADR